MDGVEMGAGQKMVESGSFLGWRNEHGVEEGKTCMTDRQTLIMGVPAAGHHGKYKKYKWWRP